MTQPAFPDNSGGPAFPVRGGFSENQGNGMSLRDYFAAKALAGLLAADDIDAPDNVPFDQWFAEQSYMHADAMLKAREGGAS